MDDQRQYDNDNMVNFNCENAFYLVVLSVFTFFFWGGGSSIDYIF